MLGGIVAAGIVRGLTPGDLGVNCRLSDGVNSARGLFIEMFGTMFLTLSVLMLAAGTLNYTSALAHHSCTQLYMPLNIWRC